MKPFPLKRLDPFVHSRVRLAILSLLYQGNTPGFADLRQALDLTDGNLGANLKQLEEAGLIKTEQDGRLSCFAITSRGRARFGRYLEALIDLVGPPP